LFKMISNVCIFLLCYPVSIKMVVFYPLDRNEIGYYGSTLCPLLEVLLLSGLMWEQSFSIPLSFLV
jgi:hypothetical protein